MREYYIVLTLADGSRKVVDSPAITKEQAEQDARIAALQYDAVRTVLKSL